MRLPRAATVLETLGWTVALAASIWVALTHGLNYGTDNHDAYLLEALKLYDSTLFNKDWVVSEATQHHHSWSYLGWLLFKIAPSGAAFAWGCAVVGTGFGLCTYWLARQCARPPYALAATLILLGIAAVLRTRAVAVTRIYFIILEPSSLGALGWLAAFAAFAQGRHLLSGIVLALGGLFHTNFLLLGVAFMGLAQILLPFRGWRDLALRVIRQVGPSLIPMALVVPVLLRTASSADAAEGARLFFQIRSPHHYDVSRMGGGLLLIAGWQMLGLGLCWPWLRRLRPLIAIWTGLAVTVWGGTLLAATFHSSTAVRMFPWRAAPFLDWTSQLMLALGVVLAIADPGRIGRHTAASCAIAVSGAALTAFGLVKKYESPSKTLLLAAFGTVILAWVVWRALAMVRRPLPRVSWIAPSLALLIGAFLFWSLGKPELTSSEVTLKVSYGMPAGERRLYAWIREHTDPDALFLTPPNLDHFRLHGRRATVIDWKSVPVVPSDTVEWYRRLTAVAGLPPTGRSDLDRGYGRIDSTRIKRLKAEFGVQYVLVRASQARSLTGFRQVYADGGWVVLDVSG
jgi:hypothetical protein